MKIFTPLACLHFFIVMSLTACRGADPHHETNFQQFHRHLHPDVASTNYDQAQDFLGKLPPADREALARKLLGDLDARVAYLAASPLIGTKFEPEAVAALTRLIANGQSETVLKGRIGYDWLHAGDTGATDRILTGISQHILTHLDEYRDKERERVGRYLNGWKLGVAENIVRAPKLLSDPNPRIAYAGATILVRTEHLSEAVPALASMIADGRREKELREVFGADWAANAGEPFALKVMLEVVSHLLEHFDRYQGAERERILSLVTNLGLSDGEKAFSVAGARRRLEEKRTLLKLPTKPK